MLTTPFAVFIYYLLNNHLIIAHDEQIDILINIRGNKFNLKEFYGYTFTIVSILVFAIVSAGKLMVSIGNYDTLSKVSLSGSVYLETLVQSFFQ